MLKQIIYDGLQVMKIPSTDKPTGLVKKSDVYSFGVVLIQLVSSLESMDVKRGADCNLSVMAIEMIQNNALDKLVDGGLGFDSDPIVTEMINGVIELAVRCLEKYSKDRPSMDEVLERLHYHLILVLLVLAIIQHKMLLYRVLELFISI
jgi:serine/threonine protein kinase